MYQNVEKCLIFIEIIDGAPVNIRWDRRLSRGAIPPSTWKWVSLSEAPPHMHMTPSCAFVALPQAITSRNKRCELEIWIKTFIFEKKSTVHSNEQSGDEHFARLNKDMTAERRPQFYLKTKIYRVCSVLIFLVFVW